MTAKSAIPSERYLRLVSAGYTEAVTWACVATFRSSADPSVRTSNDRVEPLTDEQDSLSLDWKQGETGHSFADRLADRCAISANRPGAVKGLKHDTC